MAMGKLTQLAADFFKIRVPQLAIGFPTRKMINSLDGKGGPPELHRIAIGATIDPRNTPQPYPVHISVDPLFGIISPYFPIISPFNPQKLFRTSLEIGSPGSNDLPTPYRLPVRPVRNALRRFFICGSVLSNLAQDFDDAQLGLIWFIVIQGGAPQFCLFINPTVTIDSCHWVIAINQ